MMEVPVDGARVCAVLAGRGAKRMRPDNDEYVDDDFVVDDEEEPDWRQALKSVTRYDPSKYVASAHHVCMQQLYGIGSVRSM